MASGLFRPGAPTSKATIKFALENQEFKAETFKAVTKMTDGIWGASLNAHGTSVYTLYNIANIVTVFQMNYSDSKVMNMVQLQTVTEPILREWKIKPSITLQDGEYPHNGTALPLLHLSMASMPAYLKSIEVWQKPNTKMLYATTAVNDAFRRSGLDSILKHATDAIKDIGRETFKVDKNLFCIENQQKVVQLVTHITAARPDIQAFTLNILNASFNVVRLLFERQSLQTTAELIRQSQEIRRNLNILLEFFNGHGHAYMIRCKPKESKFESTIHEYMNLFSTQEDAPYELLLFSFDYKLGDIKQNPNQHRLQRVLRNGLTFAAGFFDVWTGDCSKEVIYPALDCSTATWEQLMQLK